MKDYDHEYLNPVYQITNHQSTSKNIDLCLLCMFTRRISIS